MRNTQLPDTLVVKDSARTADGDDPRDHPLASRRR
jgi:hypothetical protein